MSTTMYEEAGVKQMLCNLHCVFDACRSKVSSIGKLTAEESLNVSQQYRDVLREAADNVNKPPIWDDFAAWSLFQCLYFNNSELGHTYDLIEWAATSFAEVSSHTASAAKRVDHSEDFWKAAAYHLITFNFSECAQLLAEFKPQDESTTIFCGALRRMDIKWLFRKNNMQLYTSWLNEIEAELKEGVFNDNQNILFLVRLLTGDVKVLSHAASVIVREWWQLVPLYITAHLTSFQLSELPEIVQDIAEKLAQEYDDTHAVISVFEFESKRLTTLQEMKKSLHVAVHLVDLIYSTFSAVGTTESMMTVLDVRNALFLKYGEALMDAELHNIGVDYLCESGLEGRKSAQDFLLNVDANTEKKSLEIFKLMQHSALTDAQQILAKKMAQRYVEKRLWNIAITWALRPDVISVDIIDLVCNAIIDQVSAEEICSLDALRNAKEVAHLSNGICFLYTFYTARKFFNDGLVHEAFDIFLSMAKLGQIPAQFQDSFLKLFCEVVGSARELKLKKEHVNNLLLFLAENDMIRRYRDGMKSEESAKLSKMLKRLLANASANLEMMRD